MSLFQDKPTDQGNSDPNLDPNLEAKNFLEELVGDGKKFKTSEDLAKSVAFKDSHIARIERENAELRERQQREDRTGRLEELFTEFLQRNSDSNNPSPGREPQEHENKSPGLTETEIEAKLNDFFGRKTQEQIANSNLRTVEQKLIETLGSNFPSIIKERAASLGLSEKDTNDLASRNPRLFYKTFDIVETPKVPSQPSLHGTMKTPISDLPSSGPKPRSFYVALRQKDPALYNSMAKQMDADAMKLGESFFDTND